MKLTLTGTKDEVPNVTTFYFKPDVPLSFKAGQFMRYHLEDPNPDERAKDRFFTIAAAPHEGHLQLTTRFVPNDGSTFKRDLRDLKIGETIEAQGPSGQFVLDDPAGEYVFIAGGIGITPFRSMLLDLAHNNSPAKITLLYANRDQNIVFKGEFDELAAKNPNLKIVYIIEPQRIDEAVIRQNVPDLTNPTFYISGPEPMVEAFEKMLSEMGVLDDKIKRDYFPGYQQI